MLVRHSKDVTPIRTKTPSDKRVLIGPKEGAPNFAMRIIDMPPGTSTYHTHDWEHEVFILSGHGSLVSENGETPLNSLNDFLSKIFIFFIGSNNHSNIF